MKILSAVAEELGLLFVIYGVYLFDYRAALIAGGAALLVLAWSLDPPERRIE